MADTTPRMRIAPSPTGEPHVGTAYTALFNWLLARHLGGTFILRIEDTDATRSTREYEGNVLDALKWTGLTWAEGPDVGGDYGPYRQSERKHLYGEHVEALLDKGHAFKCFCSAERLEKMRADQRAKNEPPRYDGHCLGLSAEEVSAKEAAGETPVVRMKVPAEGTCRFTDWVYGEVEIPWTSVDMQVVMKADGMPTYHVANVVDDHLMKITHVARGEEWVSSTPKHILLYEYLGWDVPEFIHLPLMRNADKSKLSKRKNPTSISYYSALGFLPEALMNFLGLLFIQIDEGEELLDMDGLAEAFDPHTLSKSGAVFDLQKLEWLNGRWLREKLSEEEYLHRVLAWAGERDRLKQGLALAQSRIGKLSDLPDLVSFLLKSEAGVTPESFDGMKKITRANALDVLKAVQPALDALPDWTTEAIEAELRRLSEEDMGKKLRLVVPPLFVAVSGSARSLPLFDSMALLGRAVTRQRLKAAIAVLEPAVSAEAAE
ncbi:glutamate--tRNA ligase [Pararhizobium mangrovi]|uniref:Glutamate--tRNA ligase n=1 Tax=Pararhizobium mangrovi TaxID=2590452 RepID=A0A506UAZ8_9HYPH|nr:glutamate--tRNA ligase [Pararhizobium mangrovi]TPW30698.1 glutamate--tRNA ligase [Pararhizobium mangrovi]